MNRLLDHRVGHYALPYIGTKKVNRCVGRRRAFHYSVPSMGTPVNADEQFPGFRAGGQAATNGLHTFPNKRMRPIRSHDNAQSARQPIQSSTSNRIAHLRSALRPSLPIKQDTIDCILNRCQKPSAKIALLRLIVRSRLDHLGFGSRAKSDISKAFEGTSEDEHP